MLASLILIATLLLPLPIAQQPPEPGSGWIEKKAVHANSYMIVTANPLASEAAKTMLEEGGTAIDAAIAAQMVLNVVEPQSSGIGGGGFLLYYDAQSGALTHYDGRETAPNAADANLFLDPKGKPLPFLTAVRSGKAVGTPGLLAMLAMAHQAHGALPWSSLFEPAIHYAEKGFAISKRLHQSIDYAAKQRHSKAFSDLYLTRENKAKPVGTLLINAALAETFWHIASDGIGYFYKGPIAERMVETVRSEGGLLSLDDLATYSPKQRDPLCGFYRNYKICGPGLPSSGGITLLETLGILNHFVLGGPDDPKTIHLVLEAEKIAFADRNRYLADPDKVATPKTSELLDPSYLDKRAQAIQTDQASNRPAVAGTFSPAFGRDTSYDHPSTTHISILDAEGNAASLTSSVEHSFGSGILSDGFILNNQLTDFSFTPYDDAGVPIANAPGPGKRPRSSMAPTIVFRPDGELFMVLGSPGGSSIIPYVRKTLMAVIDWHLPLQEAIDYPHFMDKNQSAILEKGSKKLAAALEAMGHHITFSDEASGIHAILVTDRGLLIGAADPRREGVALGR